MARMTKKALYEIKKKFQDKDFIIVEGVIYKKFNTDTLVIQGSKASVKRLINSFLLGIDNRKYKKELDKDIKDKFKKGMENGDFVIKDNKLYKKYGGAHERGYVQFNITINGISYITFAHRIIYYIYHGIWDNNKVINHLDGNKSNNKIKNLELISQFDNIIYSLTNDEIIFEPTFIDEITKKKYRLNNEQWEVFKKEAYNGYRRNVLKNYEPDDPFYLACKKSETLEEYKVCIGEYI